MTPLIIIAVYLGLLVGLGLVSSRLLQRTRSDYMLASHSIGPFLLLMSLFGTTMTAFALVGSTGKAFRIGIGVYGMLASSSGIVHSLCFFLIGVKLWSLGKKNGYATQIQFFRDRLDNRGIGLLLFPILVGLIIPYLLIGVMASGGVINSVTHGAFETAFANDGHGVPPWLGSLVICCVVLAYVFLGGMRGTAWANAFQTMIFMVLGVVTFVVIANALGGQDSLIANIRAANQTVVDHNPQMLTRARITQPVFLSFMLIPLSAGMFPHLFQHWLTAKRAENFKLAVVVHPIFIMIVWVPCVLVGVWATSAMQNGELLIPADIKKDSAVLGILVSRLSGDVLSGLLTAGILAAVMSSLDSQFLCIGTMFTEDIVRHYSRPNRFSDRQTVVMARCFIVGVVAVTYLLSLVAPGRVFGLGIWCFSGFTGLVPLVVAALYWRRLTSSGAMASILVTSVTWLYFFHESGYAENERYTFLEMLPVATIFAASTSVLVIVSLLTRPPRDEILAKFFPCDGREK
ncbi:MAG: sodium:solute symporter family protein [Planctomycetota bacterium]|nr:sodium:solute symporter family protein [Planctomycetota bacterium]